MKRIIFSTVCAIAVLLTVCVPVSAEATMTDEEALKIFRNMNGFSITYPELDCYTSDGTTYQTLNPGFVLACALEKYLFGKDPEADIHLEEFYEIVSRDVEFYAEYDENDPSTYYSVPLSELEVYIKNLFGSKAGIPLIPERTAYNLGKHFVCFRRIGDECRISHEPIGSVYPDSVKDFSYPDRYEFDGENTLKVYVKYAFPDVYGHKAGALFYSSSEKKDLKGILPFSSWDCAIFDAQNAIWEEANLKGLTWLSPDLDKSPLKPFGYLYTEYVMTYRKDANGNWYWLSCEPTGKNPDTSDSSLLPEITATVSAISVAAVIFLYSAKRRKTAA